MTNNEALAKLSAYEIGQKLMEADKILLFPHILMDGDTLGSSVALCRALRIMGKTCYVLIEDAIPLYLKFLNKDYCTEDLKIIGDPDLCVCIDCGETTRFEVREKKFYTGKKTMCIDHHISSKAFTDYNFIEPTASATGELIFEIIKSLPITPDDEMGNAIFAAITTDSGDFQYSNTTRNTHLIVAELYDWGAKPHKVSTEIYQNVRIEKFLITSNILAKMTVVGNGKGAVAYVTQKMLKEAEASMEETEGVVEALRSISNIEVAAFLKEKTPGIVKVSMRAKNYIDVAAICCGFGGGGHTRAAGCTLNMDIEDAVKLIGQEIEKSLEVEI